MNALDEKYTENMIKLLLEYQEYCPQVKEKISKMRVVGDGLTTVACKTAIHARRNGITPKDRLDGIVPDSGDWHQNVIMLEVNVSYYESD